MIKLYRLIAVHLALQFLNIDASAQCAFWTPGLPPLGTLTGTGVVLGIDTIIVRSQGTFAAGRPGYSIGGPNVWRGLTWRSLYVYRGAGFGGPTYTSFKLKYPMDSNYVHLKVWDIRGDGFNTEHQRVQGFLAGVPVAATFKDPQNGAFITGGNIINGAATTTALVQSSMRAFFNGTVDSIVVSRTALSDYIVMELFARCDIVLPFKLNSFSGKQSGTGILLEWKSSIESGFDYYEIERSPNGTSWEKIGEKEATNNSGYTNSYQFTDGHPEDGKNYYRLKSDEKDGSFTYSKVIAVYFRNQESSLSPHVYPNPFVAEIKIREVRGGDPVSLIRIYNYNSQLVKEIHKLTRNITISTGDLLPGTYLMRITTAKGMEYSYKLVKH